MRRLGLLIAVVCVAVLVCVMRLQSETSPSIGEESDRAVRSRQAETRYLQVQPRHWRALMLQQ